MHSTVLLEVEFRGSPCQVTPNLFARNTLQIPDSPAKMFAVQILRLIHFLSANTGLTFNKWTLFTLWPHSPVDASTLHFIHTALLYAQEFFQQHTIQRWLWQPFLHAWHPAALTFLAFISWLKAEVCGGDHLCENDPMIPCVQKRTKQRSKKPNRRLRGGSPERYFKHTRRMENRKTTQSVFICQICSTLGSCKVTKRQWVQKLVHLVDNVGALKKKIL